MKNLALNISGIIFTFIAVVHLVRYFKGWDIVISNHAVSLNVSLYASIITILLAVWMFMAAKK